MIAPLALSGTRFQVPGTSFGSWRLVWVLVDSSGVSSIGTKKKDEDAVAPSPFIH